jgi:hypothetical protein
MTAGQEWVLGDVRLHDIMQRDGLRGDPYEIIL